MIECFDDRLKELVDLDAQVEQVVSGFRFTEGPLWNPKDKSFLFCTPRAHEIQRWSDKDGLSVFREASGSAAGLTWDPQGRLLATEPRVSRGGSGRRVSRTNADGTIEAIATHYQGAQLSSPNDLVCLANGDIIFTDPDGGLNHADGTKTPRETAFNGVYRLVGAAGEPQLVSGDVEGCNGVVVRDGDTEILIADTRGHKVWSSKKDGGPVTVFADMTRGDVVGHPDGMKLDSQGNLYAGGGPEGVWVYAPDGALLGFIGFPERAINVAWGDDDFQTLYCTAMTSLYRIRMKVKGQKINP